MLINIKAVRRPASSSKLLLVWVQLDALLDESGDVSFCEGVFNTRRRWRD